MINLSNKFSSIFLRCLSLSLSANIDLSLLWQVGINSKHSCKQIGINSRRRNHQKNSQWQRWQPRFTTTTTVEEDRGKNKSTTNITKILNVKQSLVVTRLCVIFSVHLRGFTMIKTRFIMTVSVMCVFFLSKISILWNRKCGFEQFNTISMSRDPQLTFFNQPQKTYKTNENHCILRDSERWVRCRRLHEIYMSIHYGRLDRLMAATDSHYRVYSNVVHGH